jgi:hypothetical protein
MSGLRSSLSKLSTLSIRLHHPPPGSRVAGWDLSRVKMSGFPVKLPGRSVNLTLNLSVLSNVPTRDGVKLCATLISSKTRGRSTVDIKSLRLPDLMTMYCRKKISNERRLSLHTEMIICVPGAQQEGQAKEASIIIVSTRERDFVNATTRILGNLISLISLLTIRP